MTRHGMDRTQRIILWALGAVLVVALVAKLVGYIPGVPGTVAEAVARDVYAYLREMAPVFIAVAAAYLAGSFRKRSNFIASLEEEWRNIVRTKSALWCYFEKPYPTTDDYIAAHARLSETIDTMRIVYRNVGETRDLVGLYPYAPLHDMRRVLQSMDPRARSSIPATERKRAQDAITQSFLALRENFLEELDLQEPGNPLLISGGRRLKSQGQTARATKLQTRQRERQNKHQPSDAELDAYLAGLYASENARHASKAAAPAAPKA
jgi:hypothetical protein